LALSIILVAVSLSIAFIWKWADIPKTPDPAIWKGFPKEEIWRKFFSFSIPFIYGLFTLLYTIFPRLIPNGNSVSLNRFDRFRKYDFLTYVLIPVFLLMLILWRHLSDWFLWFGGFYLSVVFIKTAIFSKVIYDSIKNHQESAGTETHQLLPPHIRWGLFLLGFILYASVSLWINYSVSTTGDESPYLMITHSILYDRDFDLKNNIEQGDYNRFSWVYFPMHNVIERDGGLYSNAYSLLCFLLLPGYALGSLLPDYALGERLGSLLTLNLIASWLLLEIFLLTAEISKSYKAAFISWALVGFTSPVFFFSAQIYPEIVGAAVIVFLLRRLLNPGFKRKGLLVLISAFILISLKMRFASLALTLPILWAFLSYRKIDSFRQEDRKIPLKVLGIGIGLIGLVGIALIGSVLVTFIFDKVLLGGKIFYLQFWNWERLLEYLKPDWGNIPTFFGLIFDQEFGLLFYSPLYAFGLIGIPYLLYRYSKETLTILIPIITYIFILINLSVPDWFGGWALPSRYIVVITPLIGLISGIILSEIRGSITSILIRTLWIWSISITFILSLVTPLRYNHANGANILLKQVEDISFTRITRFFPSFISPAPEGLTVFAGLLVLFIMASILILKRSHSLYITQNISWHRNLRSFAWGLSLLLISGGLIIVLGRVLPTKQLEGENMRHITGTQYRDSKINVLVMRDRMPAWDYVVLPKERAVFANIMAAGLCNTGEAPHMVVRLENKIIGEMDILYGKDSWIRSYYFFKIPPAGGGVNTFRIELTNGRYDPGKEIFCGLYVDKVEFKEGTN
jgi:hypothetical protein